MCLKSLQWQYDIQYGVSSLALPSTMYTFIKERIFIAPPPQLNLLYFALSAYSDYYDIYSMYSEIHITSPNFFLLCFAAKSDYVANHLY